jgi:hypothetical protein
MPVATSSSTRRVLFSIMRWLSRSRLRGMWGGRGGILVGLFSRMGRSWLDRSRPIFQLRYRDVPLKRPSWRSQRGYNRPSQGRRWRRRSRVTPRPGTRNTWWSRLNRKTSIWVCRILGKYRQGAGALTKILEMLKKSRNAGTSYILKCHSVW